MLAHKTIGNKIAEARKKINISQAQLAQQLFISAQAVGKWERGESLPDITTLNRLAEILGVDLNYFSENFSSATTDSTDAASWAEEGAESPAAKLPQKRSWDMSGGNWQDADFSGLKHLQEKFSGSNLQRCQFIGADLAGLLLKSNHVDSCDFSGSDISNSHLQYSHFHNNLFKDCSLKGSTFTSCHIKEGDFSGADISGNHVVRTHFDNSQFRHSSLQATEFLRSYIKGGDFSGADFTDTVFKSGSLLHSNLTNAVWHRTAFQEMQLADLVFDGAWADCSFEDCAFSNITFQNATLTNIFFKGKSRSMKQLRFMNCQVDKLTYAFLKSGKADLTGITLLTS
ncbi:pentapeptide repeat-containing protein [Chitinophaga nivalis]|uniref:Pentapeptide repeat-containing protein n=1 Tax=Chitinophaga nivalis TaxID=2991709 RepID=A0ABT3IIZ7_9BACT|nr:pentapeptide repeat-containing protein [Chitinophaga nivalis]MCW3466395.1 pentapeptide repeat-containing protein [Chitinophaga nivalis]MCW3483914.1 pentapeptide repeat-containing protein [Chitinophaga nivalis]